MALRVSSKRRWRRHLPLSMKAILKRANKMTEDFRKKYIHQIFRINQSGQVQRQMGKRWFTICIHNRQKAVCASPLCNGKSVCKHGIRRSDCKIQECKGGGANCDHGFRKGQCKKCGHLRCKHGLLHYRCNKDGCNGTSLCEHGKLRNICPDKMCGGGTSLCIHDLPRSKCHDTKCGAGTYCKHDIARPLCIDPECEGGGSYCGHNILRRLCPDPSCEGGTGLCIKCFLSYKSDGDYCTRCHPNYIPTMSGASKIGCKFLCQLQSFLAQQIQHKHYDIVSKNIIGSEYRLPEYKTNPVDGFYIDTEGQKIVIEFLGDIFHGHPSLWGEDEKNTNRYGEVHKDNFYNTERIFIKVASFGYIIRYVWECDYKKLKALQSPQSILREFKGKLEY